MPHGRVKPPCSADLNLDTEPTATSVQLRVVVQYSNRSIEKALPSDMLRALLPSHAEGVQLVWTYLPKLKDMLYNTDQFRFFSPAQVQASLQSCCSTIPHAYTKDTPYGRHLHTHDPGWFLGKFPTAAPVCEVLHKGLNHIPCAPADDSIAYAVNQQVMEEVAKHYGLHVEHMCLLARQWTAQQLHYHRGLNLHLDSEQALAADNPVVQYVTSMAFVAPLDKANGQPYYMCVCLAKWLAHQQVHGPSYRQLATATTLQQLRATIPECAHLLTLERDGTLFPIYKIHKDNNRFITTAAGTTLTALGLMVSSITRIVLSIMQHVAGARNTTAWNLHRLKVQYYPIIQDVREMLYNLPAQSDMWCDFSCDVESCYDTIPTSNEAGADGLQAAIAWVLSQCRQWYRQQHPGREPHWLVKQHARTGIWLDAKFTHKQHEGWTQVSCHRVVELVDILLQHSVIQVGGVRYTQSSGIPQGISPGPDLANLYLLSREFRYLDRSLNTSEGRQRLRQHSMAHWYRYIDDVRMLNNGQATQVMTAILPTGMQFKVTTEYVVDRPDILSVTSMLNVETTLYEGGFTITDLLRKEEKLPIQVVQYSHLRSTRPIRSCYSSVVAQVLTVMWACNHATVFKRQLAQLLHLYVQRGYNRHKLLGKVVEVIQRYQSIVPHRDFEMPAVARALRRV